MVVDSGVFLLCFWWDTKGFYLPICPFQKLWGPSYHGRWAQQMNLWYLFASPLAPLGKGSRFFGSLKVYLQRMKGEFWRFLFGKLYDKHCWIWFLSYTWGSRTAPWFASFCLLKVVTHAVLTECLPCMSWWRLRYCTSLFLFPAILWVSWCSSAYLRNTIIKFQSAYKYFSGIFLAGFLKYLLLLLLLVVVVVVVFFCVCAHGG